MSKITVQNTIFLFISFVFLIAIGGTQKHAVASQFDPAILTPNRGLEFDHQSSIIINRQDLSISEGQIEVRNEFFNNSPSMKTLSVLAKTIMNNSFSAPLNL